MEETAVNLANSRLEEKACKIMDKLAPMKTVQTRTTYKNWISNDTKADINLRFMARNKAK